MKKFEIPEINISMFDAAIATEDSALVMAKEALEADFVDSAKWGTSDWTITF